MSRSKLLALQISVAVVMIAIWYVFSTYPVFGKILLPPFFFSNPVAVAKQVVAWFVSGVIWKHLWVTLQESILAFIIGSHGGGLRSLRQNGERAAARRAGAHLHAVARFGHLVEGRARRHARLLHRVL